MSCIVKFLKFDVFNFKPAESHAVKSNRKKNEWRVKSLHCWITPPPKKMLTTQFKSQSWLAFAWHSYTIWNNIKGVIPLQYQDIRRRFRHCRQNVDTLGWEISTLSGADTQAIAPAGALDHICTVLAKLYQIAPLKLQEWPTVTCKTQCKVSK